jgi:hypothetical protein
MKKKTYFNIFLAITAFLLISFLFSIYNSFKGNPLSAKIADTKIRAYVNKTYPTLDLTVSETKYNFKDTAYFSRVQSKNSQDTCFTVSYCNGTVTDDYEYEVANKFTTYRRLSDLFNKDVENIISKDFPYVTSIVIADYGKGEIDLNKLILDMPYDIKNPPVPASLVVNCLSDEVTYEVLSKRLLELKAIMDNHHIPISIYSLVLEPSVEKARNSGDNSLYLYDFPAEKIDNNNLINEIKKHQTAWEQEADHKK